MSYDVHYEIAIRHLRYRKAELERIITRMESDQSCGPGIDAMPDKQDELNRLRAELIDVGEALKIVFGSEESPANSVDPRDGKPMDNAPRLVIHVDCQCGTVGEAEIRLANDHSFEAPIIAGTQYTCESCRTRLQLTLVLGVTVLYGTEPEFATVHESPNLN